MGTLQRFPKIVGNDSLARELALTGRPFGATEALHIGFISRIVQGGRLGVTSERLATSHVRSDGHVQKPPLSSPRPLLRNLQLQSSARNIS
jgi:enoyl-CoA hydratase/carnithine racemase